MKLQSKLTAAFGVMSAITLGVAVLGYIEVRRLGLALYEIGTVRLPSIEGLEMINEAKTDLAGSIRILIAGPTTDRVFADEMERQRRAWLRAAKGWGIYEPLPQATDEAVEWKAFVSAWRDWKAEYEAAVTQVIDSTRARQPAVRREALERYTSVAMPTFVRVDSHLNRLVAINSRIASEAKAKSIASREDMVRAQRMMSWSALAGGVSAIALGLFLGRRLSRPMVQAAETLSQIARGDFSARMPVLSDDETGRMMQAMNSMAASLHQSEARLRVLSDNLPNGMVYQLQRAPDGTRSLPHVSAGLERLTGLSVDTVRRDARRFFELIRTEDQEVMTQAEIESARTMTVLDLTICLRSTTGVSRWVHFSAAPRPLAHGNMMWDGVALDVSDRKQSEMELRRANRALRILSSCNQALVHASDERELLRQMCEAVRKEGDFWLAWVGFMADVGTLIEPAASAGEPAQLLAKVPFPRDEAGRVCGPTGLAIHSRQPVVCRDILADRDFAPWRNDIIAGGGRSAAAIPLLEGEVVLGVFTVYADKPNAFDAVEMKLLTEVAGDMAYGIQVLRERIERDRVARALRESEERFRLATQHSAIGMALVSPDGRWVDVNPALCQIVGYSRAELLKLDSRAITHPDDFAAGRAQVQQLIKGVIASYSREKRYRRKDGRVVWVQITASLLRDTEQRPLYLISQIQDVTDRKAAETLLAASKERLQLALRASKLGVWRRNLQTGEAEWDERMFAIYGRTPGVRPPTREELMAATVPEDRDIVHRFWERLEGGDSSARAQFRIRRADGEVRHVESQGIISIDPAGHDVWAIGVGGDITELVSATEESARLRERLLQAQKMETLGTLAAGVAHDFNNLLTGINGFMELAAAALPANHESVSLLHEARRGALSARDIVRRILTFSHCRSENHRISLDVRGVVRDSMPLISALLPPHVALSIDMLPETPPIHGDAGQIQQVLLNLCSNGAHAIGSARGTLHLSVRTRQFTTDRSAGPAGCRPGNYIWLAVTDSGCGMDAATVKRIFEPFFTTRKPGEGTGLGLAIVRDVVLAHEGAIAVESTPGRGTTFNLYFPEAAGEISTLVSAEPVTPGRGTGQRILIVDDEPTVAAVVRIGLERNGYAPEAFTSSEDAWQRFARGPSDFALVISDHRMPGIGGEEFVRRVQELLPSIPILMMSGRFEVSNVGPPPDEARTVSIKKPFEITELLSHVHSMLNGPGRP